LNWRKKIPIFAASLIFVTVLLSVIRHFQLQRAVDDYKAELKAQGEPMELSQVLPPAVPPERNRAETFLKAAALMETDESLIRTNRFAGMRMIAPGKALVRWQQPDVRDNDSTNSWNEITAAVDQNHEALELLCQITLQPNLRFPIDYQQGVAGLGYTNLHLAELKRSAQYLGVAAIRDLHLNDAAGAVRNARAMLALATAMQDQRLVISELVRIAIANIAVPINWEILRSTAITDEQLAALQSDWQGLDLVKGYKDALVMERVDDEITLEKWRGTNSELLRYLDLEKETREKLGMDQETPTTFGRAKLEARIFLWRHWWSYADELRSLKGYAVLVGAIRFAETNGSFRAALSMQSTQLDVLGLNKNPDEMDIFISDKTDFHSMLSQSIVGLGRVIDRVMRMETARQIVITAIALKRYQIKHGNFPEKLSDLVPEFLATVPQDPVDGQLLRYRLKENGTFLLYSVGANGKDDGGDPRLEKGVESSSLDWLNQHALDWVWPQPATAQEIQKYYDDRSRKSRD
jgi:hypothetical protein